MPEIKKYTVTVEQDPESQDLLLPFPQELLEELGWESGDTIYWHDNHNGSYTLTKKDSQQ